MTRITATDDELRRVLADANLPALLPALAHLTGDLGVLRPELAPDTSLIGTPTGFSGESAAVQARDLALSILARYRDAGSPEPAPLTDDLMRGILRWISQQHDVDAYVALAREELAVDDLRAPAWTKPAERVLSVAIIGAGMSGLLAAHRLQQAGVPYVLLEKEDDLGGTWKHNAYPGCRVDVPNALYSYSFAQRTDWPDQFSTQPALLAYLRDCAQRFALRVRFRTEVVEATWHDDRACWRLRVRTPAGEDTIEANAVISAVGQLDQPKLPVLAGRFAGPAWHSARWNHDVELAGKRVAVIGTGASAAQFVPALAERAAQVDIYQRTPNWILPVPDYHAAVPAGQRWLLEHVPHAAPWYRFWLFWRTGDGMLLPRVRVDPAWRRTDSVSAGNEELRAVLAYTLRAQLAGREDLIAKATPSYPPGSKRILFDDGAWYRALQRPNVSLVTDGIRELAPGGVVATDGTERPADAIIYATGFSQFVSPTQVIGRGAALWNGEPRAYLGTVAPGFPNWFFLYGPNTNVVVNGSIIYFSECQMSYVLDALRLLIESGARSLDVRSEVHDRYNAWIDDGNASMAWGASTVASWYRSASGRISQNWPFTLLAYWQHTRRVAPADFTLQA